MGAFSTRVPFHSNGCVFTRVPFQCDPFPLFSIYLSTVLTVTCKLSINLYKIIKGASQIKSTVDIKEESNHQLACEEILRGLGRL